MKKNEQEIEIIQCELREGILKATEKVCMKHNYKITHIELANILCEILKSHIKEELSTLIKK